jgi:hypothetical protein
MISLISTVRIVRWNNSLGAVGYVPSLIRTAIVVFFMVATTAAQTLSPTVKEYVRASGRLIAVETNVWTAGAVTVSVSPSGGAGSAVVFTAKYSDLRSQMPNGQIQVSSCPSQGEDGQ